MPTISDMRLFLMSRYPKSVEWHRKVVDMPTRQVIAIYQRMNQKKDKPKKKEGYHQIDMFEYMASLTQNNTEVNV